MIPVKHRFGGYPALISITVFVVLASRLVNSSIKVAYCIIYAFVFLHATSGTFNGSFSGKKNRFAEYSRGE